MEEEIKEIAKELRKILVDWRGYDYEDVAQNYGILNTALCMLVSFRKNWKNIVFDKKDEIIQELKTLQATTPAGIWVDDRDYFIRQPRMILRSFLCEGLDFNVFNYIEHFNLIVPIFDLITSIDKHSVCKKEWKKIKKIEYPKTVEHICVVHGFTSFLDLILKVKYPIDILVKGEGKTLLHIAVKHGREDMVSFLLKHGASVLAKAGSGEGVWSGFTSLHFAVNSITTANLETAMRYERIAVLLLESGADINVQDDEGKTPLHRAVSSGNERMVQLLLEKKCKKNILDKLGHAPVHYAYGKMKDILS